MSFEEWQQQNKSMMISTKPDSGFEAWTAQNKTEFPNIKPVKEEGMFVDFVGEALKGIPRGFLSVGKGIVGTVEWAIPGEQKALIRAEERIETAKKRETIAYDPHTLAGKAGAIIGEAIPYMGSALVGGAAGAALRGTKLAAGIGAAMVGFSVEGQNAYDEAIKTGATKLQANTERVLVGSVNAAIEAMQIGQLLKFKEVGKHTVQSFVKNVRNKLWQRAGQDFGKISGMMLRNSINEGVEEFLQEGVSIGVPGLLRGEVPRTDTGKVDWSEIGVRLGASAAGGAVAGMVLGGGMQLTTTLSGIAAPTKENLTDIQSRIEKSGRTEYTKALMLQTLNDIAIRHDIDFKAEVAPEAKLVLDTAKEIEEAVGPFEAQRKESKKIIKENLAAKAEIMREVYSKSKIRIAKEEIIPETRGKGIFYHGTSTEIPSLEEYGYSPINIYGSGFYTTEALDIAQGYTTKGKGKTPTIYKVDMKKDVKLFDMRKTLSQKEKQNLKKFFDEDFHFIVDEEKNLQDIYDAYRYEASANAFMSDTEIQETFDEIRFNLEKEGYSGLIYEGGKLTKQPKHEVRVFWDAPNILNIKKLETIPKITKKFLSEKTGLIRDIYSDPYIDSESRTKIAKAAARDYNRQIFPELTETISAEQMRILKDSYHASDELGEFEKVTLDDMFWDIQNGVLPHPSTIKLFDKTFGTNLNAVIKKGVKTRGFRERFFDLLNVRKALMASGDASFGGRQGWFLMLTHPVTWAKQVGKGYRAMASRDYMSVQDMEIKTHEYYPLFKKLGLEYTEPGMTEKAPEETRSDYAKRIPFLGAIVRGSDRAFASVGNSLRWNWAYRIAEEWEGTGKSTEDYKALVHLVNAATGRGTIPAAIQKKYGDVLNATFWAPRLFLGKIQTLTDMVPHPKEFVEAKKSGNWKALMSPTRKMMAGELVRATITLSGIIAVLSMIPGMEIEKDPRSSDFGKGKHGNTRFDFLGGYQQIIRLVANLISGQQKSTVTGIVSDRRRSEILGRFLRGKLSPTAATIVDAYTGYTYMGEKTRWTDPEFTSKYIWDTSVFLFAQDVIDAINYEGLAMGAMVSPLAVHGIGAQTYEITPTSESMNIKNKYAMQFFGSKWNDLGPEAQAAIEEANPLIKIYDERARIERENFNFVAKMLDEQNEMGRKVQRSLDKEVQKEFDNLGIDVGGFSRNLGKGWFLNKDRHKQYAELTKQAINKVVLNVKSRPEYQAMPPIAKKDIMQGIVDDIKKTIRQQLIAEANFKDLDRITP